MRKQMEEGIEGGNNKVIYREMKRGEEEGEREE